MNIYISFFYKKNEKLQRIHDALLNFLTIFFIQKKEQNYTNTFLLTNNILIYTKKLKYPKYTKKTNYLILKILNLREEVF